jgi:xanthine dehydrogenase accessory factor
VIEIDPRGDPALVRGIGERPARMADGVLRAIDVVA